MFIGIHAKALSEKNPTGVAEYTRNLLDRMVILPEAEEHRFLFYVDSLPTSGQVSYKLIRSPIVWTQGRLAIELFWHTPDAFFVPQHVLPKTAPKKSVVTIHGLEFERFPQFYPWHVRAYLRWVTKNAVYHAARVIAVSHATKRDLMELYDVPEKKIVVVYHGAPEEKNHKSQISNLKQYREPYFLYVGRIEKKKNVDGIIRAFSIAKEQYKLPHQLVLAGGDGYGAQEIKSQKSKIKNSEQVIFTGYISEEHKWKLLCGAEALVFPGWYEGFGLPILEAQVSGTPVITSSVSAMPEVAGGGAIFVDPANPESIAEAMHNIAADTPLRKNLVEGGLENIKRFSWERCAKDTLTVLSNA